MNGSEVWVPPEGSWASSAARRRNMQAIRSRDTGPEQRIRRLVHAQGLRYRVAAKPLPNLRRTADMVFRPVKVAVFIDGCYWHGCPEHHRPATKRAEFWQEKIAGNRARDADTNASLNAQGWAVVRVWEHEEPETAADRISGIVRSRLEKS